MGPFFIPLLGKSVSWLEFPAISMTTTIRAEDGTIYAAIEHLDRIQAYDREGNFITGWFVDARGGIFLIGVTKQGYVAAASVRSDQVEFFTKVGESAQKPVPIPDDADIDFFGDVMKAKEFAPLGLTLTYSKVVPNPAPPITTLVLFPFINPFMAWAFAGIGGLAAFGVKGFGNISRWPRQKV